MAKQTYPGCYTEIGRIREILKRATVNVESGLVACRTVGDGCVGVYSANGYLDVRWFPNPQSVYRYVYAKVHRIVYFVETGTLPEIVDHINGQKTDNRFDNLRPATRRQNGTNRKGPSSLNKSTGIRGVCWREKDKGAQAHVCDLEGKFRGKFFSASRNGGKTGAIEAAIVWVEEKRAEFGYLTGAETK